MTRQEWTDIARALAKQREKIETGWKKRVATCHMVHRLVHAQRLTVVDECARAVCAVLRSQSSRFDERRFLAIAGVDTAGRR